MRRFIERAGEFVGKTVGVNFLESLRGKVEKFKLQFEGQEHIEALEGQQYILVANHLMPESGKAQQSQLSPDAFVLEKMIRDLTGRELRIVSKCDDGWWSQNDIYRAFQKDVSQPFTKGASEGMGFVPIFKNPGTFNRDFVRKVNEVVADGQDPILMFPEGHWYEDFNPEHKLENGVATISKKHQLPIVPTYIQGARSWESDTEVKVIFGEPFYPEELTKEEITEQIRLRLTELQKTFQEEG